MADKPVVRLVIGWVEPTVIKPHGGRAQTRASNIKLAAADRLEGLVDGTHRGRGVENTDTLKAGDLLPAARLARFLDRIASLRGRIDKALQGSAETQAKAERKWELVERLRSLLAEAKDEALSIWRDMPPGAADADMALRLMDAMGGNPGLK